MRWDIGAYREKIRQRLHWFRSVKTWQLVIVLLLGLVVTATLLRLNNLGMVDRRHAVIQADDKGDAVEIEKRLKELRAYVTTHMNTSLGQGFYLNRSYERARDAAVAAFQNSSSNASSSEYQTASIECRARFQGGVASFRNDYVRCVAERVAALPPQVQAELKLPDSAGYRINYVSPLWSFDLAGLGVAFCLFIVMVICARFIGVVVLQLLLKKRFSHV